MTKYYTCHGVHFLMRNHQFVDLHETYLWYSKDSLLADLQANGFTIDQSDNVVNMTIVQHVENKLKELGFKKNEYLHKYGISPNKDTYIMAFFDEKNNKYIIKGDSIDSLSNRKSISHSFDNETAFFNKIKEYLSQGNNNVAHTTQDTSIGQVIQKKDEILLDNIKTECNILTNRNTTKKYIEISWKLEILGTTYVRETEISIGNEPLSRERENTTTTIEIPLQYDLKVDSILKLLLNYLGAFNYELDQFDNGEFMFTNTIIYQEIVYATHGIEKLTNSLFANTFQMIYSNRNRSNRTNDDCVTIFESIVSGFENNLVKIAPFMFKKRQYDTQPEFQNYENPPKFKYIGFFRKTIDDVEYIIFDSNSTQGHYGVSYQKYTPQQFDQMVSPIINAREELDRRLEKYKKLITQNKVNLWTKNKNIRLYIKLEKLLPDFNSLSNNKKHKYTSSNPYIDLSQAEDELVTPMGSRDIRSEIEQEIENNLV